MADCVCDPLTKDGYSYSQFLGNLMHDCIYTPSEIASVVLGLVNIVLWVIATIPQMMENYRRKVSGRVGGME